MWKGADAKRHGLLWPRSSLGHSPAGKHTALVVPRAKPKGARAQSGIYMSDLEREGVLPRSWLLIAHPWIAVGERDCADPVGAPATPWRLARARKPGPCTCNLHLLRVTQLSTPPGDQPGQKPKYWPLQALISITWPSLFLCCWL
jgi:hypothetical protein